MRVLGLTAVLCSLLLAACGGSTDHRGPDKHPPVPQAPALSESGKIDNGYVLNWGVSARAEHRNLFIAWLKGALPGASPHYCPTGADCVPSPATQPPATAVGVRAVVGGNLSGSNPVSDSATWTGQARVIDRNGNTYSGKAYLEADLVEATISVDITGTGISMSLTGLDMQRGTFSGKGKYSLQGAFYGNYHEGIAGKFTESGRGLMGVFGALRSGVGNAR